MDVTFEQLAQDAMQLAPAERAELADFLVGSLETSQPDDLQRLWIETAAKRLSEIRSGRVRTIPGEDVIAEARRLVNR
jgi:hypothetical protein